MKMNLQAELISKGIVSHEDTEAKGNNSEMAYWLCDVFSQVRRWSIWVRLQAQKEGQRI